MTFSRETDMSLIALLPELGAALRDFLSSPARFRIVKTILSKSISEAAIPPHDPQTLLILDSSFNPPSRAHAWLAQSALRHAKSHLPGPHRLVLLFSTNNADKAPSPAAFDVRLGLMTLFAHDIAQTTSVPIDIALTNAPFYTDKSRAITHEGPWAQASPAPRHVHVMGYDTVTRFLGTKYYKDYKPPLSAVAPYFEAGHQLHVALRPSEKWGSVQEQRDWIDGLRDGRMDADGAQRQWAHQVTVVEADETERDRVHEVSSSRIRELAKKGAMDEVRQLCTPSVSGAIVTDGIYKPDN